MPNTRPARYTAEVIGTLIFLGASLIALMALLTGLLVREMVRPPRHTIGYALAKGLPTDPADLGMAFESWALDRPDGAQLPVWEVNGTSGVETGQPISRAATAVFIHGWGHSRIDMLARMTEWQCRSQRQVYYDLRGHGDAEGSLSALGHQEDDDLLALLERLGNGPFVLIGEAMGAVIALAAAARDHPARAHIAGVFAYAPYADFHPSLRGRLRRAEQPTRPMTDLAMLWLRMRGRPPRSVASSDLLATTCPIAIVHGEEDVVSPSDQVRWIEETLARRPIERDDAGVYRIALPQVGHELVLLSQGAAHDEAVERFLRMIEDARTSAPVAQRAGE